MFKSVKQMIYEAVYSQKENYRLNGFISAVFFFMTIVLIFGNQLVAGLITAGFFFYFTMVSAKQRTMVNERKSLMRNLNPELIQDATIEYDI